MAGYIEYIHRLSKPSSMNGAGDINMNGLETIKVITVNFIHIVLHPVIKALYIVKGTHP